MRAVTTTTVRPRSTRSRQPVRYVVAGVYGTGRAVFTDRDEAAAYAMTLAYGSASEYTLVG